ncbi:MAG: hypothetical protein RLZZ617_10, partial [Bacteroidota bacterium]
MDPVVAGQVGDPGWGILCFDSIGRKDIP